MLPLEKFESNLRPSSYEATALTIRPPPWPSHGQFNIELDGHQQLSGGFSRGWKSLGPGSKAQVKKVKLLLTQGAGFCELKA